MGQNYSPMTNDIHLSENYLQDIHSILHFTWLPLGVLISFNSDTKDFPRPGNNNEISFKQLAKLSTYWMVNNLKENAPSRP